MARVRVRACLRAHARTREWSRPAGAANDPYGPRLPAEDPSAATRPIASADWWSSRAGAAVPIVVEVSRSIEDQPPHP